MDRGIARRRQQIIIDHIPWVHRYKNSRECTATMFRRRGRRCKNPAYWRFTSLKSKSPWFMGVPNGVYCWSHLIYHGLYGSMDEEERTRKRLYERGVLCPSISSTGARCVRFSHTEGQHHTRKYTRPYSDDPDKVHCDEVWDD